MVLPTAQQATHIGSTHATPVIRRSRHGDTSFSARSCVMARLTCHVPSRFVIAFKSSPPRQLVPEGIQWRESAFQRRRETLFPMLPVARIPCFRPRWSLRRQSRFRCPQLRRQSLPVASIGEVNGKRGATSCGAKLKAHTTPALLCRQNSIMVPGEDRTCGNRRKN